MIINLGNNVYIEGNAIRIILPSDSPASKQIEEEAKKRNKLYNVTGKRKRRSLVVMSDGSTFYSLLKAETIYKRLNKEGEAEE